MAWHTKRRPVVKFPDAKEIVSSIITTVVYQIICLSECRGAASEEASGTHVPSTSPLFANLIENTPASQV